MAIWPAGPPKLMKPSFSQKRKASAKLTAAGAADSKAGKDVLAAMDAWKQAMLHKDRAALERLLHKDLIFSHSDAKMQTKPAVLDSVLSGKPNIDSLEFSDAVVRVYGKTALVRAKVDVATSADGKRSTGHVNALHVWIRGAQGWQLVARQATRLPQ